MATFSLPSVLLLLSVPLLYAAMLITPSRAFIRGLAAARDPGARVTPQSPWYFFDPVFRRRVRIWRWLLPTSLILFSIGFFAALDGFNGILIITITSIGMFASILLAQAVLIFWAHLLWAPRCKKSWSLSLLTLITGLPLLLAMTLTFSLLSELEPFQRLLTHEFTELTPSPSGGEGIGTVYHVALYPFLILPIACGFAYYWWRRIHRDDRWFRLDS